MSDDPLPGPPPGADRRTFIGTVSSWFMTGGLVAGYGACAAMGGRYLFPARERKKAWLFVARAEELRAGDSLEYRAPDGERIAIARKRSNGDVDDFIALSSTCPHLGCQVHWQAQHGRFFCPCHNGAFSPDGVATAGPPAEAGQTLPRFPLKLEDGLLYIEVPTTGLARAEDEGEGTQEIVERGSPPGPGHDPCLYRAPDSSELA